MKGFGRNVYVAVFDNTRWTPVAYGHRKGLGKISFQNLARNALYLPVVLQRNGEQIPLGCPFFIHSNGDVEYLKTQLDKYKKTEVTLVRKYPVYWNLAAVYDRTRGGIIQGSDSSGFETAETVAQIPESYDWSGIIPAFMSKPYRYYRFCAPDDGACDLAELKLYNENNYIRPNKIWTSSSANQIVETDKSPNMIIDDDALTWFSTDDNRGVWVGLDYGAPQQVTMIYYSVRSDGNDFYPGFEYVLRRWNGSIWEKEETFVGTKEICHSFRDLQDGTLYLITCNTTGTQSRPFVVRNGKAYWL